MKLVLLIHSHPGSASDTAIRHWPYFQRSGAWKIIGVGPSEGETRWPAGVITSNHGGVPRHGLTLAKQLVDSFAVGLAYREATHIGILEYDAIATQPWPDLGEGLFTQVGGYRDGNFRGDTYFHIPWVASRRVAEQIVAYGTLMINQGDIEGGHPDRFLGWMFQRFDLPWHVLPGYSKNSLDQQHYLDEAREAVRSGKIYAVHGVKSKQILDYITS